MIKQAIERYAAGADAPARAEQHPGQGHVGPADDGDAVRLDVGTTVEQAERLLILKTLEATNNNKTRAAEILGISLKTLHNKLNLYRERGLIHDD